MAACGGRDGRLVEGLGQLGLCGFDRGEGERVHGEIARDGDPGVCFDVWNSQPRGWRLCEEALEEVEEVL